MVDTSRGLGLLGPSSSPRTCRASLIQFLTLSSPTTLRRELALEIATAVALEASIAPSTLPTSSHCSKNPDLPSPEKSQNHQAPVKLAPVPSASRPERRLHRCSDKRCPVKNCHRGGAFTDKDQDLPFYIKQLKLQLRGGKEGERIQGKPSVEGIARNLNMFYVVHGAGSGMERVR